MSGAVIGRLLVGLGMGLEGAIHPVYVCELADKKWRGSMAASGVIVITCGLTMAYVIGSFISWRASTRGHPSLETC